MEDREFLDNFQVFFLSALPKKNDKSDFELATELGKYSIDQLDALFSFYGEPQTLDHGEMVPARVNAELCRAQWPAFREYLWTWCTKEGVNTFSEVVALVVKNESADPNFKRCFSEIAKLPKVGHVITKSTGEAERIGSTVGRILTNR